MSMHDIHFVGELFRRPTQREGKERQTEHGPHVTLEILRDTVAIGHTFETGREVSEAPDADTARTILRRQTPLMGRKNGDIVPSGYECS
jgi:hypothetical protein